MGKASQTQSEVQHELEKLLKTNSGPFIATVKSTADENYMGRLKVWIPQTGGDPNNETNWVTCDYVSPFYGITNTTPLENDSIDPTAGYDSAPTSYGLWMVPPDPETQVLVMFVAGVESKAVWLGCVPRGNSNHMVPGIASRYTTLQGSAANEPITEANKKVIKDIKANPSQESLTADTYVTSTHDPMLGNLERQGLITDRLRGVSSSSSRREAPSQVFGILTPGRPKLRTSDVNDTQNQFAKLTTKTRSRYPGHQFVLDDGDRNGENRLVRLRSGDGQQIVMNDSAGFIYIVNNNGTAWVEITNDGKVDIFATDSISFNTKKDFNLNAEGNVNINTTGTMQVRSGADMTLETGKDLHMLSVNSTYQTTGDDLQVTVGAYGYLTVTRDYNVAVNQALKLTTTDDFNLTASANVLITANSAVSLTSDDDQIYLDAPVQITGELTSGAVTAPNLGLDDEGIPDGTTGGPGTAGPKPAVADAATLATPIDRKFVYLKIANHVPRIPDVEPWFGHEARSVAVEIDENDPKKIAQRVLTGAYIPTDLAEVQSLIDGMAPLNFDSYRETIAARESGGKYATESQAGFLGRYQMGVLTLVSLGIMSPLAKAEYDKDPKYYRNNQSIITEVDAWWIKPASKRAFLNDPQAQDVAFVKFTYKNFQTVKGQGALSAGSSAVSIGGALAAAHLGGPDSAVRYIRNGVSARDQFGSSVAQYFLLGQSSQST